MFERQVLGEDYWKKQAATEVTLFPSGAPAADALVRGEVSICHRSTTSSSPSSVTARRWRSFLRPRDADQSLCCRHYGHSEEPQRRQAVPKLVPVGRQDRPS